MTRLYSSKSHADLIRNIAVSVQISKRGGELDVVIDESRVRIGGACSFYLEGTSITLQ